jgi:AcrR family transcriptional regulator
LDEIRNELLECGTKLFTKKGYKETKVKDVTQMACISVGTFYNYFGSKEDLFLDIYIHKHNQAKRKLLKLFEKEAKPTEIIEETIYEFLNIMRSDPVLRAFFNPHVHDKYRKSLDMKKKNFQFNYAYDLFSPQLKKWQEDGAINKDIDIRLLLASIDSIFYVLLHKNDIGDEFFPEIIEFLISGIICKLEKNLNSSE